LVALGRGKSVDLRCGVDVADLSNGFCLVDLADGNSCFPKAGCLGDLVCFDELLNLRGDGLDDLRDDDLPNLRDDDLLDLCGSALTSLRGGDIFASGLDDPLPSSDTAFESMTNSGRTDACSKVSVRKVGLRGLKPFIMELLVVSDTGETIFSTGRFLFLGWNVGETFEVPLPFEEPVCSMKKLCRLVDVIMVGALASLDSKSSASTLRDD
jgi:hypothetical protein